VSMGIVLNDAKDASTGEIVTTWSVSSGTPVPHTNFETGKSG
jgi:hypothetical protein